MVEYEKNGTDVAYYFLSNLPNDTPLAELVEIGKLRWRIERDYQDMKQEVGLSHFEGRRWHGLNHHLTLCMAAHTFLALQREVSPPRTTTLAQ